MEVAKLDSNNIVVADFLVKTEKMLSADGSVTQASCQTYCESMFGSGTYIPLNTSNNEPNMGWLWDNEKKAFHEGKPLDIDGNESVSWVWNTEHHKWHAPTNLPVMSGYRKISWRESNSRWYGKPTDVSGTDTNWHTWNSTTSQWEDTGSKDL